MKPAIIDTDTVSYFFRNNASVVAKLDEYLREYGFVYLSVVTFYEVLNGLYYRDAKKQIDRFERFVELNEVLSLSDKIAKRSAMIYADLRAKGQTVGHNDILIAGTAITHDLTLVTNNVGHFSRVAGLEIDNWTKA